MYHRFSNQTLLLIAALTLAAGINHCAAHAAGQETFEHKITVAADKTEWQLPPSVKQLKLRPRGIDIFAFDEDPVGNRAPLLLVHGMKGEFWDCFRWKEVCQHLNVNQAIKSKYKIFLARYDSYLPLDKIAADLGRQIIRLSHAAGDRPAAILALSMGGNVVAQAMLDPLVNQRVSQVLTLGTPFHGTPLFTCDWMTYSLLKHYRMPLSRLDACLPYRIYFTKHQNLLSDLRWDNSDQLVPSVGQYRSLFPVRYAGTLSPQAVANTYLPTVYKPGTIDKSKFTVYGAYLDSAFARDHHVNPLMSALKYPLWFARTTVPEHCGKEHPVLRVTNQYIACVVPNSTASDKFRSTYPYGLNDGITPLASSLFLPGQALSGRSFSTPADVRQLSKLTDVGRARVFRNIDHLTFIDGYIPPGSSDLLKDELSPAENSKTIFDWMAGDLLGQADDQIADTK